MLHSSVSFKVDTGPHIYDGEQGKIVADSQLVTGVQTRWGTYEIPDYNPVGEIITREIKLPREMAKRLGHFFLHCYVDTPPSDRDFDCHSFVSYMMGQVDNTTQPVGIEAYVPAQLDTQPTAVADMQPYKPYGFVAWEGDQGHSKHSALALPGEENLSVLGVNSKLFIADTEQMIQDYGAQTAHRIITPPQYHD